MIESMSRPLEDGHRFSDKIMRKQITEKGMAKSPKTTPLVDHKLIHELTRLLDETGLTEIEIEQNGQRVRVARARWRRRPHQFA